MWDIINVILKAGALVPVSFTASHRTAWCIGAVLESIYTLFRLPGEPKITRFVADELATAHWFNIMLQKNLYYSSANCGIYTFFNLDVKHCPHPEA